VSNKRWKIDLSTNISKASLPFIADPTSHRQQQEQDDENLYLQVHNSEGETLEVDLGYIEHLCKRAKIALSLVNY